MTTVVIAPDSFKGSLSARAVAAALADGWRSVRPGDDLLLVPLADGGEGTLDAIEAAVPSAVRHSAGQVTGPDGRPTPGEWLALADGVAVIELAQASGLPLMGTLDPLGATTRGTGEVIRAALAAGATSIVIGLGGSASTGGGAGALAALGFVLLDEQDEPIADGGGWLRDIVAADRREFVPPPPGGVVVLTDVTAPLLGPHGAAAVFGPQKGATPAQVALLDQGLAHYAHMVGGDPAAAGAGAAGGAGFGFATIWGARIVPGAEYLAQLSGINAAIEKADVVLTGEGRFDAQSLGGKTVGHILTLCEGKSVGIIAGQVTVETTAWSVSLADLAGSVEAALGHPEAWLRAAGAQAAKELGD